MNSGLGQTDELLRDALRVPHGTVAPADLVETLMADVVRTPPRRRPALPSPRLRVGRLIGPIMATAVLVVALALALAVGGSPPSPTTACRRSPAPSGGSDAALPEAGRVAAVIPRGDWRLAGAEGDTMWVAGDGLIARLDPDGGPDGMGVVGDALPVPTRADEGGALRPGGWWLSETVPGAVVQFDPVAGAFGLVIELPITPYRAAAGPTALYVTDYQGGRLVRVDLASRAITADVPLVQAAAVAVTADGLLLVSSRDGRLQWRDPVSLRILGESRIQGAVMSLVQDGQRMIIQRNSSGWLTFVDPLVVGAQEYGGGASVTALALTPDAAWAAEFAAESRPAPLLRLDRDTLQPVARTMFAPGSATDGIVFADGAAWMDGSDPVSGQPSFFRIEPDPCLAD